MSTQDFNRGLDDAANGEEAKNGERNDYYLGYDYGTPRRKEPEREREDDREPESMSEEPKGGGEEKA